MAFTTSTPDNSGQQQPVAIVSVDTMARMATAMTRRRSEVQIDLRYHAGGIQTTPAVGEHWFVAQDNSFYYRLISKIPQNADEMLVEPVEGQVQVGSKGPLELHGTVVNVRSPLQLAAYATADRPTAADYEGGAMIYDLTLHKPVFSDGTVWRDAGGTTV